MRETTKVRKERRRLMEYAGPECKGSFSALDVLM